MYGVMRVKIEFEIELPDVKHSKKQLEEYIRYHFRDYWSLSGDNPFYRFEEEHGGEPEPVYGSFKWRYK